MKFRQLKLYRFIIIILLYVVYLSLFNTDLYALDRCKLKRDTSYINSLSLQDTIIVNYKNINLSDLLWKLEKKCKFNIVFNPVLVKRYKHLDINIKGRLEDVLAHILKDKNLNFSIENGIYVINRRKDSSLDKYFSSNKIKVFGKIKDDKNNPLAGVSVIILGTSVGVITDSKG